MSTMPCCVISSPENVCTEIGTSCKDSSRLRAVTRISSIACAPAIFAGVIKSVAAIANAAAALIESVVGRIAVSPCLPGGHAQVLC
jgi:hypothetical protein